MKKALLFLLLASPCLAGGPKNTYPYPHGLDDEMQNIYHDIKNPVINYGTATTFAVSTLTATGIVGTKTNDNALAGNYGEYISSFTNPVNTPADNTFGEFVSVTLTAGDWDLNYIVDFQGNGATWSNILMGIGTVSGNSAGGLITGDNIGTQAFASSATTPLDVTVAVPGWRASIASTTTYYGKIRVRFSAGGPPMVACRLSARRVR